MWQRIMHQWNIFPVKAVAVVAVIPCLLMAMMSGRDQGAA